MDALPLAGRFPLDRITSSPRPLRAVRVVAGATISLALAFPVCLAQDPAPPAAATVIAMAEARIPGGFEDPAPLAEKVGNAVAAALREHGFEVLPPEEFTPAWRSRLEEAGGYFDIVHGRPDLAKRRALRAAALREMQERHGARVALQPELVVVEADYFRGKASWDGAKERAAPDGSGEVPALSLLLRVEDLAGRETVSPRAGIQVLAKHSAWKKNFRTVPWEKLLADEARLGEAVDQALQPVLEVLRAAPGAAQAAEPIAGEPAAETAPPEIEPPPEGARVAALSALLLPDEEIVVRPEVRERYAGLLRARLEAAGWWVLPPEVYESTYDATARELGGIYDPITGRGDPDKRTAAVEETRGRLAERYGIEVFVRAGIRVRMAYFAGETATWDGVSEQVADRATWKKLLTRTRGKTKALSFGVLVEDPDGENLYAGWGGIQLAEVIERDRFVPVSPESLFADPSLDERAVDLAFEAWTGEPGAAEAGE